MSARGRCQLETKLDDLCFGQLPRMKGGEMATREVKDFRLSTTFLNYKAGRLSNAPSFPSGA